MVEYEESEVGDALIAAGFAAAKKHLCEAINAESDTGKCTFICLAIECAESKGEISHGQSVQCRDIIGRRLKGIGTLQGWLRANVRGIAHEIMVDERIYGGRKMQVTRMAWLDSLIEEFSPQQPGKTA